MKNVIGNKKALSPVVAAIILIAVTVAVSIAVAAWMGSLSIGNMETIELTITNVDFTIGNDSTGRITVQATNSGTSPFTVNRIRVNGENAGIWSSGTSNTVSPGHFEIFTITQAIAAGSKYAVTLYDIDNTMIGAYTATA